MKLFGKWRSEPEPKLDEHTAFVGREQSPGAESQEAPTVGKGRKIMVVDDNQVVLKAFELKLKSCGFEVITASEGALAVTTARSEQPDLIVLDINFPPDVGSSGLQWNGFNIMQWLQRFQEVSHIPIIVITSGDPAKFKERAIEAGAFDFFQKPINFDEFLLSTDRAITGNGSEAKPA